MVKAVVFDLFGTLVDNFDGPQADVVYEQIAEILDLDPRAFDATWHSESISSQRLAGRFKTFEACLAETCRVMGVAYDPARVPRAVALRTELTRRLMQPRDDTIRTLREIRCMGLKIGLVSDCSWEVPQLWPTTAMAPFVQAAVFSCSAGMKKPDPGLYAMVCRGLAVEPSDCLYVGDCGSDELAGARRAGMNAALICVPYEEQLVMARPPARAWNGPRVSSVAAVLDLLNVGKEMQR